MFDFSEGIISSLKWSAAINNEVNEDNNEQNKQALLFNCKTYNLEAPGTIFLKYYVLIHPGGTSTGPFA